MMSMMTKISKIGAATAVMALMATGASAATLSLVGVGYQTQAISNFDPVSSPVDLNNEVVSYLTGDVKAISNGLWLDGPAKVTYTYLGYEAGNSNYAAEIAGTLFTNGSTIVGESKTVTQGAAGLVDFLFGTTAPPSSAGTIANNGLANPQSEHFAIGYYKLSDSSWYVLFDDKASNDRDFDDLVMRIDVAPIPLPAAGWLLLGGIGALGLARRRRKAA